MNGDDRRIEPVLVMLFSAVIFFTLLLIAVAKFLSMDGQAFQVISGLVTGFSGALLMRVKPRGLSDDGSPIAPILPNKVTTEKTEKTVATSDEAK